MFEFPELVLKYYRDLDRTAEPSEIYDSQRTRAAGFETNKTKLFVMLPVDDGHTRDRQLHQNEVCRCIHQHAGPAAACHRLSALNHA